MSPIHSYKMLAKETGIYNQKSLNLNLNEKN